MATNLLEHRKKAEIHQWRRLYRGRFKGQYTQQWFCLTSRQCGQQQLHAGERNLSLLSCNGTRSFIDLQEVFDVSSEADYSFASVLIDHVNLIPCIWAVTVYLFLLLLYIFVATVCFCWYFVFLLLLHIYYCCYSLILLLRYSYNVTWSFKGYKYHKGLM